LPCPVRHHNGLAGAGLVVGVSADLNNKARNLCSKSGVLITLDGGGGSTGQAIGRAACELVAQPEIARLQISNNSAGNTRRIPSIILMPVSDVGQLPGLGVFDGAGVLHCLDHCGGVGRVALGRGCLSPVTTP